MIKFLKSLELYYRINKMPFSATLMEKWAKQTQRDMDSVNMALKRGGVPPPVKWEQRHIEAIKINTDLG